MTTMTYVGPVVHTIARIWSNRFEPETAGARFVVSDRGDILSPKYAPEIMIPAVRGAGIPSPAAIPISATPTVPPTPQDEPVARDTTEQIRRVARRNIPGESRSNP